MSVTDNGDGGGSGISEYLGLSEAARRTPGRPSTNCVWRWCDNGILVRSGERVKLKHIRVGGKIFTTLDWLHAFWEALADREAAFSDAKRAAGACLPPREQKYSPPRRRAVASTRSAEGRSERRDEIENELNKEGF